MNCRAVSQQSSQDTVLTHNDQEVGGPLTLNKAPWGSLSSPGRLRTESSDPLDPLSGVIEIERRSLRLSRAARDGGGEAWTVKPSTERVVLTAAGTAVD